MNESPNCRVIVCLEPKQAKYVDYQTVEVILNGSRREIRNALEFEFNVGGTLKKSEVLQMLEGTEGILSIQANYEFPEDRYFEGVDNKYVPFANAEIRGGRFKGNTTRCVDAAIQILFDHGKVFLADHWDNGTNNNANRHFKEMLSDRIQSMRLVIAKNEESTNTTRRIFHIDNKNWYTAKWLYLKKRQ